MNANRNHSLVSRLNEIADLFVATLPDDADARSVEFYENDEVSLYLSGENCERFYQCVEVLLNSFDDFKDTISRESFTNLLIPLIRAKKTNDEPFSVSDAEAFEKKMADIPLQKYRVVRPIFGIQMSQDAGPADFGNFRIDFGRRLLVTKEVSPLLNVVLEPQDQNRLFIQCEVLARDRKVAGQRANALLYRFELIFRFFIGDRTDWVEVGITNYKGAQIRNEFIFTEDGRAVGHGSGWQGALQAFIVGHPNFPKLTPATTKLFSMLTEPNNEFEKHIIRCAEWTGQAISEPNEAAALVKAAIALEVLFSPNEKGIITSGIMSQIAESCAFLLAGGKKSPEEIERKVKDLYAVRSSVVHSGKDSIDTRDLTAFIKICRQVVLTLLSKSEFAEIESMANLAAYFKNLKYAGINSTK